MLEHGKETGMVKIMNLILSRKKMWDKIKNRICLLGG